MLTKNFDKNNYEFNPESTIGIYLIHGFSSSTYELKILAEFLSKKNYHVVLNNLPGHGTTVEDCNQSEYTDWLDFSKIELAILCSQSNQSFILGVSMGAVIGLYLSTLFPINGLIIGGTVLKIKLWWNTNVLNTLFCRFIKMRKKELILPIEKRKKTSFLSRLIAFNLDVYLTLISQIGSFCIIFLLLMLILATIFFKTLIYPVLVLLNKIFFIVIFDLGVNIPAVIRNAALEISPGTV